MTTYSLSNEELYLFETLKSVTLDDAQFEIIKTCPSKFGMGFKGFHHTPESKAKIAAGQKNRTLTEAGRAKLSALAKGRPQTPGRTAALKALNSKPRSAESNAKRSATLKGIPLPRVTCPHCGTSGSAGNIARWHGINCKAYTQPNHDNP
jgi:hypothetical protein